MSEETRKGTRCAVCVGCGKCFEVEEASQKGWSGHRCEVCVSCGECAKAWGLAPSGDGDVDAVSGATNWADAFKVMDTGTGGAPPSAPPPGMPAETDATRAGGKSDAANPLENDSDLEGACGDVDAVTGATPGVATACKELGLDDMASLTETLGIKPPGQS